MSTPDHPLPWRWTDHNADALLDGDGRVMLVLANAGPVAPHVRAVTERSGAMEALLRELAGEDDLSGPNCHHADGDAWCPDGCPHERARALLAEIDAAK